MVIEIVYLVIKNSGVIFSLNMLLWKFPTIHKIRENNLMSCTYVSLSFNNFQHFAELLSSTLHPQLTSTRFVSFCFLEYFKANSRHHTIPQETNKQTSEHIFNL